MADNKYDKMPVALLPQVYKQVVERKEALENIINKQYEAMEEALHVVKDQLKECDEDLTVIQNRMK